MKMSNFSKKTEGRSARWEVGGEFHWMAFPRGPFLPWPQPASWYLLGRHAVVDLLRSFCAVPTLWLPGYFCQEIADYWGEFFQTRLYADNPRWPEPDWSTLRPSSQDVVLAVNYFGARGPEPWRRWREKTNCVLLEDHSHDPGSGWTQCSTADYAFSSLRKTLPVPDGAILWSPRGKPLPEAAEMDFSGSGLKLAAMIWKREYLRSITTPATKSSYREWQKAGEVAFDRSLQISRTTPYSQEFLASGIPVKWLRRRAANVRRLLLQLRDWTGAQPLFRSWPADGTPLAAVLCFLSEEERNSMRRYLEAANIYCPVHWPGPENCDAALRELAGRILSIPADQRYSRTDMDNVARIMRNWAAS